MASETKMNLKILVNEKTNKVAFAEAEKEFVDFIFSIMSLRLSTVTKLLTQELGMVGSLGTLYKSIYNNQHLQPDISTDYVLKPTAIKVPLLSLDDVPYLITYYKCDKHPDRVSDRRGTVCPFCKTGSMTSEFSLKYVPPSQLSPQSSWTFSDPGYVKGGGTYMVMDNLEVKPMSISLIRSFGGDFNFLVEKYVTLGCKEGLAILKASLENEAVLTTVFLGKEETK